MAVQSFAAITEHFDLDAAGTVVTFAGGQSFRCYGIVASADGTAIEIEVTTAGSPVSEIMHFRLAANATSVMNIPFLADKGLKASVTAGASTGHITVLRANSGT